jgi:hypothetical protein
MGNCRTVGQGVRRTLLYSALIAAMSIGANALADIERGNQNGIAFENGGWSGETAEVIHAHAAKFPVMLVFAWTEGAYLADVGVQVLNGKGDKVLNLNAAGPLVLIDLPKGQYTINVERHGKSQSRQVSVGSNTRSKAVFHWAKDDIDRRADVDTAASRGSPTAMR